MRELNILITGYSSFRDFKKNPSQVVVEKLRNEFEENELVNEIALKSTLPNDVQLNIYTEIIEVDYQQALIASQNACLKKNMDFVIHVGVHNCRRCIKLETRAFAHGYVPLRNSCEIECSGDPSKVLETNLELDKIIKEIELELDPKISIQASTDPGRYLCGYIYYCSLNMNKQNALFVHIPDFDNSVNSYLINCEEIVTEQSLTQILKRIICEVLKQKFSTK